MRIIHDNCIVNANSEYLLNNAIQAFLFLPSIILNSELKQHKSNTLIKKLQEAIQNRDPIGFVLNQRAACISKAYSSPQRRKQKESTPPISAPLPKTLRHKVENLTKKGNLAKALKVITSHYDLEGVKMAQMYDDKGEINLDLVNEIRLLHPQPAQAEASNANSQLDMDARIAFDITEEALTTVITKLPKESSTGLLSWSNELIQYLYFDEIGFDNDKNRTFRKLLFKTISLLAQGKLGPSSLWIKSLFIPLKKKNGKIRPIAVDNIFIRICGKAISLLSKKTVGEQLLPIQYGIGIRGGCEMIVHTTANWITQLLSEGTGGKKVIIKLDLQNAFNTIDRDAIRRGIAKYSPELLTYYNWAYGTPTSINLQDGFEVAKSYTGVRQGDPLGPLFFCLGLQTILSAATSINAKVDCYTFMDDITLYGEIDDVMSYLNYLAANLPSIGLNIAYDKSSFFSCNIEHQIPLREFNIPCTTAGLSILGCPVGTDEYIHHELHSMFADFQKYLEVLNKVQSSIAYLFLRFCVNTKPSYITRTCPPWLLKEHAIKFDTKVNACIAQMINEPFLDTISKSVRTLPVKLGGLGISSIQDTSPYAWIASYTESLNFTQLDGQQFGWEHALSYGDTCMQKHCKTIQDVYPNFSFANFPTMNKTQKDFMKTLHDQNLKSLTEMPILKNNVEHYTWFSASQHLSCPWLTSAIGPINRYRVPLNNYEMQINLKLRLLIPLIKNRPEKCSCDDGTRNNQRYTEYHALGCIKYIGDLRTERHNDIRDIVHDSIKTNIPSFNVGKEVNHYHPDDPRRHKKPDITLVDKDNNDHQIFIDMAVINIGGFSYLNKNNASVLTAVENGKRFNHKGHLDQEAYNPNTFIPFIVDTVGNIGPSGKNFLNNIASRSTNKFMKHGILRSISISIARKNAEMYSRYIRLSQLGPS